jgi:hypothetical protein
MKKFNLYGFITFFGILFLVILYKVINLPVTIDEVPTVWFYSKYSFWEIMMYPDNIPNNHILNTLLAKCSMMIFGKEQWAIRLPSLLSFIVFGFGVFRILKLVLKPSSYFFLPAAILFINPYWLDFFGLCRGYAISTTMVTCTIAFMIEGFMFKKSKFIWFSLVTSILASYANFSALVFWVATSALVWFYFFIETKKDWKKLFRPTIVLSLISFAYLALIITPIIKMQSTNEFQYWTSRGFYSETIKSLIVAWWYNSKILSSVSLDIWATLLIIIVFIAIFSSLRNLLKSKFSLQSFYQPIFVTTAILLLPALVSISQSIILKTPNLNGRTAMFFFPLISALFATILSLIPKFKRQWINKSLAAIAVVILVINLTSRVSLKYVKEFYFDQNTLEVINYLKEKSDRKPVTLKTSWFFNPSFYFYAYTEKIPWIDLYCFDSNIDITTSAEYYYIWAEDYKQLEPRFEVVYKFSPDRWLLKQRIR